MAPQETEKIRYETSVSLIWYRTGDSQKSTDLNSILSSLFMKIQMKTVINWDFSNCNCFISTNGHNYEIIDFRHNLNFLLVSLKNTWFHIIFPKHNLDFPLFSLRITWSHIIFQKHKLDFSPVSLRNTRFHVVSLGIHKHKMVQWVWNGLKLITEAKNDYILIYLKIAPLVFCIRKYCIISFRCVSFVPVQLE
jgi:hypothetical protein